MPRRRSPPPLRERGCRAGLRALAPMVKNIDGECSPASSPVPAHPDPSSISTDAWRRLESATFFVMHKIHPTVSSEHLRARVIDYVQRLFRVHAAGYQALPFGSVPLKTYLPHGDIDLTLFGPALSDENLENEVCAILKSEEQRKDSEFEVKDVKYVPANKVKLVKCKVQNISVDISVNQIGGLCTLYFLEKVDQNFRKNHLFRRSVMLIKDWCYYESKILGAHNGLISYALEILVLYIIHIFHKSLDGPLAVLYRFLNYYSKFDWYNKGISLLGPVSLSSLPELFTEPPDTHDEGFLEREKFLKECAEVFSVPIRNSEENPQVFSRKFLNIVDPLKQSNNLGRSVSKENFVRIRYEFYIGAHKLGKILPVPPCFAVNEISRFFSKTLEMADVLRPDVLVSSPDDVLMTKSVTNDSVSPGMDVAGVNKGSSPNSSCGVLSNQFSYIKILDSNNDGSVKQKECNSMAEYKEIKSASWVLPDSDARSHATTTDSVSMRNGGDFSGASPSPSETRTLQSGRDHCAQHLLFQSENVKKVDVRDSTKYHKEFSGSSPPQLWHNNACSSLTGLVDDRATSNSVLTPKTISQRGATANNIVSDLAGGSGINFHNLLYARGLQQDSPSSQLYNYPMLAKNGAAVPGPLYQTDDHMAMGAHGTGGTNFPESNLLVDRVQVNTRANDHGTTALAAPASSSPSWAPRQPPPPQPASLAPPSPCPPFAWPGGGAQQGGADCRGHGLEGNAGGVTGGWLVGIRGDPGVGAEGPAAPVASARSKARMRRPRARGRRQAGQGKWV